MVKILLEKSLKVAVYSGVIPSTNFIENLLKTLSKNNVEVVVIGKKKEINYFENSKFKYIYYPENKLNKIIFICFQGLIFFLKNKQYLIEFYKYYNSLPKNESGGLTSWLIKVLPVVNNLPDIFHLQWAKSLPFWFFLKEIFGIKIIVSLRGAHINYSPLSDSYLKSNYIKLFPKVDSFHAVSAKIAIVAGKYGASKKDTRIIYSGINFKEINFIKKRKPIKNELFSFISVGRNHWKKGYHYSISAFDKIISMGYEATYTILLSNKPSEEILYQIKDLNLKNNIKIISELNQLDIYKSMYDSNCLVLPSVEEGIANVVLESMALGTLVISSNCGGMEEVIQNNKNGLIFESRNVNDLTDKMVHAMKIKKATKRKIISNAKKTSYDNYHLNRLGYEMKKLYLDTLNDSK